jgi:hypothetical protein
MSDMATKAIHGQLHRISAEDFSTVEIVLETAALLAAPDKQTQRQAFEKLVPLVFVLLDTGCSWTQIATYFAACGFNLKSSSMRTYFNKMYPSRQAICQQYLKEQKLLLAEVRKSTQGTAVEGMHARVAAILEKQRADAVGKAKEAAGECPT